MIQISFTPEQLASVLNILAKEPYISVFSLIAEIQKQAQAAQSSADKE